MVKPKTIYFDGRKIGTYESFQKAGTGHINFCGFKSCEGAEVFMSLYDEATETARKARELNERLIVSENKLEAINDDDSRSEIYKTIKEVCEILESIRNEIY